MWRGEEKCEKKSEKMGAERCVEMVCTSKQKQCAQT